MALAIYDTDEDVRILRRKGMRLLDIVDALSSKYKEFTRFQLFQNAAVIIEETYRKGYSIEEFEEAIETTGIEEGIKEEILIREKLLKTD